MTLPNSANHIINKPYAEPDRQRYGRAPIKGLQAIGKSRGGWNTQIHLVALRRRRNWRAVTCALTPGAAHDGLEGRVLLCSLGLQSGGRPR